MENVTTLKFFSSGFFGYSNQKDFTWVQYGIYYP